MPSPSYKPVQQHENIATADDLEDPPVIVPRPLEVIHAERVEQEQKNSCWNTTRCAGCVGATAGCCMGGFWTSAIFATTCIYCAATQDGVGGDIARACGTFGVQANIMARDLDDEYHVVDQSKAAASNLYQNAKAFNQNHQVLERTQACIVSAAQSGAAFAREHQLVQRTTSGVAQVVSVVTREIYSSESSDRQETATESSAPEPEVNSS